MEMCEDYPCCGHEFGDCNGAKYGSDESIKNDPHLLCDHENGDCELFGDEDDYDDEFPGHLVIIAEEGVEILKSGEESQLLKNLDA